MKLLIVEDDAQVRGHVQKGMGEAGHAVDAAADGEQGLHMAQQEQYDVIILDRMLPKKDGLDVLKQLRGEGNATPVLVLSALSDVDDRVKGLRAGGDDYMTKPFAMTELQARVDVLGRRSSLGKAGVQTKLSAADVEMDLLARKVTRSGNVVDLQTREFSLLEYLLKNKGQLVTRTMLLESVWNYHFDPQTNVIDVHISRLRKKLDDKQGQFIQTVRGAGYIIEDA